MKRLYFTIIALCSVVFALPAQATDFVFAPAPVTGGLAAPGEGSGNLKLTLLSVDSGNTSITGIGGSMAARNRIGEVFGLNFAGNLLVMEDDDGTFTATSVNLMAGPDFYLGDNVIVFVDGSFGSTSADVDAGPISTSTTTDVAGFSYGIQINLGSNEGFMLTPYFMAVDQTVSTEGLADTDISSSVIGLDILINNLSLAALFQSSDDTDIVMFSIGTNF